MVVAALHVDDLDEAAFPLVQVVGHVGHEVGVRAIGLAHHAVLVVAIVGAAQPQCTVFLVGLARGDQARDRGLELAARVQARFEEVTVKAQAEGLQVEVLFVAQVGHRELAHAFEVSRVARGAEFAVVGPDGLLRREVGGNVGDVVALVGRLGPVGVARLAALEPGLD